MCVALCWRYHVVVVATVGAETGRREIPYVVKVKSGEAWRGRRVSISTAAAVRSNDSTWSELTEFSLRANHDAWRTLRLALSLIIHHIQ